MGGNLFIQAFCVSFSYERRPRKSLFKLRDSEKPEVTLVLRSTVVNGQSIDW